MSEPTKQNKQVTQICIRRLHKEMELLIKDPIPNIKIYVSPENILKWYFCIHDLADDQYKGGEFYGLIEMDHDYPNEPPSYFMYTPNGRFKIKKEICTTNSKFHKSSWRPTWTLDTLFRGFLSLFLEKTDGADLSYNHMHTPKGVKQHYSDGSRDYNKKYNPELYEIFESNTNLICDSKNK
jgi:ubiquitin-conjugating enzyme E2 J2